MAYFYFNKGTEKMNSTLLAIVENSEDQVFFPSSESADICEVSTEDFKKIQLNTHSIKSYDGSNFVFEIHPTDNRLPDEERETVELLQNDLNKLRKRIGKWMKENPGHAKSSEWSDYKTYLENVDVASIVPIGKNWEEYCNDNSIAFKHIIELPHK